MSKNLGDITGVIMAAGMGTRLGDITAKKPKALVEVNKIPLIIYALSYLKKLGIKKRIVVGGFCFDDLEKMVKENDPDVVVMENKNYTLGNLYTLEVALDKINGGFFLMNVDHIYSEDIISMVKKQLSDNIVAFTDSDRILTDDDMKVLSKNGLFVKDMSKKLTEYDRGYVGKTFCSESKLFDYRNAFELAKERYKEKAVAEDVLRILGTLGDSVVIGDISGSRWCEVDNKDDLKNAETVVSENCNLYSYI